MVNLILVGVGGMLGSMLRYWLSGVAQRSFSGSFPLGTLTVNVLGCLVVGAFWSLVEYRQWFTPETRIFVTIGILGGFTTFSAFGYETFALLRDGQHAAAILNVLANVLVGTLAVIVGWVAAKSFAI
jgi:CrcB protein